MFIVILKVSVNIRKAACPERRMCFLAFSRLWMYQQITEERPIITNGVNN